MAVVDTLIGRAALNLEAELMMDSGSWSVLAQMAGKCTGFMDVMTMCPA